MSRRHRTITALVAAALLGPAATHAQPARVPPPVQHDGAHDFDFLLRRLEGAHVKRLPGHRRGFRRSTPWVE